MLLLYAVCPLLCPYVWGQNRRHENYESKVFLEAMAKSIAVSRQEFKKVMKGHSPTSENGSDQGTLRAGGHRRKPPCVTPERSYRASARAPASLVRPEHSRRRPHVVACTAP
eukprot:378134-Prymnesium_polylepis.2